MDDCKYYLNELNYILNQLKNNLILLQAFTHESRNLKELYSSASIAECEKILIDAAEQYSYDYLAGVKLLLMASQSE